MFVHLAMPLAAVLLLSTGMAFAQPADKPEEAAPPQSRMADVDTNQDGSISSEEADAQAAKKFEQIDSDKDGAVSLEEMDRYRAAEKMKREAARADREDEMKEKYHKKIDPDGDGKVSRDEFIKNAKERHSKMDGNADGIVTKEEIKAMRDKDMGTPEERRKKWMERRGDGVKPGTEAPKAE